MTNRRVTVNLTPKAQKDLKRLRHDMKGVARELKRLESDPLAGHPLKGTLIGARSLEFTLKGGGAYRAVYAIHDDGTICLVFIIGAHENIYKQAESRLKALRKRLG